MMVSWLKRRARQVKAASHQDQDTPPAVLGRGVRSLAEGGAPFWRTTPLAALSPEQWEALCDGCGKCCLLKLQDDDEDGQPGEVHATNVACRLLDRHSCRCSDYAERWDSVPDCVQLFPAAIRRTPWLPPTCAYRLLDEGHDLPEWHPLVTGDPESIHRAGKSVRGRCIDERKAGPLDHHLVDWDDL